MKPFTIRTINPADKTWISRTLTKHWGAPAVVSRGVIHQANLLPGFIAIFRGNPSGLVTYHIRSNHCEIVTLDSLVTGIGIGKALLDAVCQTAQALECRRVWLITTNDNMPAIRYYQKKGFRLVAVYPNAIQHSRKLKPCIPKVGLDGIPIRDEIEFEKILF